MPRYAALIYGSPSDQNEGSPEQWAQIMAEYNDFGATAGAAGVLAGGDSIERRTEPFSLRPAARATVGAPRAAPTSASQPTRARQPRPG